MQFYCSSNYLIWPIHDRPWNRDSNCFRCSKVIELIPNEPSAFLYESKIDSSLLNDSFGSLLSLVVLLVDLNLFWTPLLCGVEVVDESRLYSLHHQGHWSFEG